MSVELELTGPIDASGLAQVAGMPRKPARNKAMMYPESCQTAGMAIEAIPATSPTREPGRTGLVVSVDGLSMVPVPEGGRAG